MALRTFDLHLGEELHLVLLVEFDLLLVTIYIELLFGGRSNCFDVRVVHIEHEYTVCIALSDSIWLEKSLLYRTTRIDAGVRLRSLFDVLRLLVELSHALGILEEVLVFLFISS